MNKFIFVVEKHIQYNPAANISDMYVQYGEIYHVIHTYDYKLFI